MCCWWLWDPPCRHKRHWGWKIHKWLIRHPTPVTSRPNDSYSCCISCHCVLLAMYHSSIKLPPPCDGPQFAPVLLPPEIPLFNPQLHRLTYKPPPPPPPVPPVPPKPAPSPQVCKFLDGGWCYRMRHQTGDSSHPPEIIRCPNLGLDGNGCMKLCF